MSATLEPSPIQRPDGLRGSILGNRVSRTEDPELLTGAGKYIADLDLGEGALHAVFVRSDIAHGIINSIDVDEARSMPGVVAVWTADELDVAPHHGFAPIDPAFARPPLATDRVRFVGEAVAVVFAETAAQGADAADAVWADIEPIDAVTDSEAALAPDAPLLRPERGDNIAVADAPDSPVDLDAISDVVVRGRFVNQRVAVAPMEPHGVAAAPADDDRITVWTANQFPHYVHAAMAAATGIDRSQLHIVTPRVGGGFGGKAGMQHEYTVVVVGAQRLGRPVRWIPTRTEDMQAKDHSRSQVQYAELGCTTDGAFTGLRVRLVGDAGAYPGIGAALPGGTRRMSHGTYAFPQIDFDVAVATTNTPPTGAYRGAGRPEATALLERLVDQAAHQLGIDPIELREKNLLTDDVFPFQTLTGPEYDTGSYRMPLREAARLIGYDRLRAEQQQRREAGDTVQLGVGVATYVEITGGGGGDEFGKLEVHPDGTATVSCGTLSHGQGHQTTFAMIVSAQTGIPVDRIRLVDGDTDFVPKGGGTGGSRSVQYGGSAVNEATKLVVERAKQLAARVLEADEADIVVDADAGTIGVAGVPAAALSWADLATKSEELDDAPLAADTIYAPDGASFPF
ncbi:MAG: xanthine dehydrogenase family protein molybdopterin-binding subunit, partial [Ilumatobacter fluminis]